MKHEGVVCVECGDDGVVRESGEVVKQALKAVDRKTVLSRLLEPREENAMPLETIGNIAIPDPGSLFDHGAFEPTTRRVFVAHTARDRLEVIDHDNRRHLATLRGFPEAAGVVANVGQVLVTNRGAASLAWVDGRTLETQAVIDTGPRPNGVAIVAQLGLAIVACIGDETQGPELHVLRLGSAERRKIDLPGRPRWCVTDAEGKRVFLAIRNPSMVLVAGLPDLDDVQQWPLPSDGAHGLDIDQQQQRLYAACDDRALVEVDARTGRVRGEWPLAIRCTNSGCVVFRASDVHRVSWCTSS